MSIDFLTRVCAEARGRVAAASDRLSLADLRDRASALPLPPGFAASLRAPRAHPGGLAVIAEVKRASPSRGALADIPDPAELAAAYAAGGAAAVSVLTEPRHFRGDLDDLRAVASRLPGTPTLRKDFVVDVYQVWEARAAGAAAVLLIVAALGDLALAGLLAEAEAAGLDALVEAHSEQEVTRAAAAHANSGSGRALVLGVNARNLTTLDVDLGIVERVAAARPPGAVLVAESGISGPADARRMAGIGADAVLVGEHVATSGDPAAAVAALVSAVPGRPSAAHDPAASPPAPSPPRSIRSRS